MKFRSAVLLVLIGMTEASPSLALDSCDFSRFFGGVSPGMGGTQILHSVDYRMGQVIGNSGTKAHLYDGVKDCPKEICRRDDFLVPGDELVVSAVAGDWACVFHVVPDPKDDRVAQANVGWVAMAFLHIAEPNRKPVLKDWLGTWAYRTESRDQNAHLELRVGKVPGTLSVDGVALGYGGESPNLGMVEESVIPRQNGVLLKSGPCQIRMVLLGGWLVAGDNLKWGGMNVTFNGVYRRVQK
jgi:hypothetical protein